jgi:hypothetical protein
MAAGKGTKFLPGDRSRQAEEELEANKRATRNLINRHIPDGEDEQWGKKYPRAVKTPPQPRARPKTDRDRALKVLAKVGVTDPENDEHVREIVYTAYHNAEFFVGGLKAERADEAAMAKALQAVPTRSEQGKEKQTKLLSQLRPVPPEPAEPGRDVDVKLRSAICCAEDCGWPWTVAAACVYLFAADGCSYNKIYTLFKDHAGRLNKAYPSRKEQIARVIAHRPA